MEHVQLLHLDEINFRRHGISGRLLEASAAGTTPSPGNVLGSTEDLQSDP